MAVLCEMGATLNLRHGAGRSLYPGCAQVMPRNRWYGRPWVNFNGTIAALNSSVYITTQFTVCEILWDE